MAKQTDKKIQKKETIIRAAAEVFAKKGFAGTVMADIAVQAGLGKGTLYEYFKSKDQLFFAVFKWFTAETSRAVQVNASVLGAPASQKLLAINDSLMNSWGNIKGQFTLFMEFWAASSYSRKADDYKAAFNYIYSEYRRMAASVLREGIDRGEFSEAIDVDSVAAALVGTWDALFLQAWYDESFNLIETSRNFLAVVLAGLSRLPAGAAERSQ